MTRRSGFAAVLVLFLLAGPLGLLELDHGRLHDESAATHSECPLCFAAREPAVGWFPSTPLLPEPGVAQVAPTPRFELPEPVALLRTTPPRGPPSCP